MSAVVDFPQGEPRPEPPHNLEAEQALLAALLAYNGCYDRVSDTLQPEHFYDPAHQRIYTAMATLIERGDNADPVTLAQYFDNDADLQQAGGPDYLHQLQASVVAPDPTHYAKTLRALATRRTLQELGQDILWDTAEADVLSSPDDLVESVSERLYQLQETGTKSTGPRTIADISAERLAYHEALYKGEIEPGILTGLRDLDDMMAGLHKTDLTIVAARPSMGKTHFAVEMAYRVARRIQETEDGPSYTQPVLFFQMEMSDGQISDRMSARLSGIDLKKFRDARHLDAALMDRFITTQREKIAPLPLHVDTTPSIGPGQMHTRARRVKRKHGLALIVVDYLQLMAAPPGKRSDSRVQEVSAITRALKIMAKDLNVPVIALSQLSRAVEARDDKRPQLADLRESGSIEQDADNVLALYRDEYYAAKTEPTSEGEKYQKWLERMDRARNLTEALILKQRSGPVGTVRLYSDMATGAYADLEWRERCHA